jgi:UDP-glucose 4-epimerase
MKKVLVTGGAGFIGSHLVEKLVDKGYDVTVIDNLLRGNKIHKNYINKIKFIFGDIRDKKKLESVIKNRQIIFHLAAYLGVEEVASNPQETMNIESIGTANIIDLALKYKVKKLIYISTSGVYGKFEIEKSVTENFNVSPVSSYAIAKRFNEIYLQSISKKYPIKTSL